MELMDSNTLRTQYLANEIFRIGDIVEDSKSGEQLKILDRGSNYVTVESSAGIKKKWFSELIAESETIVEKEPDFIMTETGQLKMFGYETKSFDEYLTYELLEQFSEFDDLYSKHQIVKLIDISLSESDLDKRYDALEKVSAFYAKQQITEPLIIEGFKTETERLRLAQIIAVVAGIETDSKSPYKTIKAAVEVLRKKYTEKKQWLVLWPFFVLIHNAGIHGILNTLPFKFDTKGVEDKPDSMPYDAKLTEEITQLLEDNIDELFDSFILEDAEETFSEDEYEDEYLTEEQLDEVLSFASRLRLGRKMSSREGSLEIRRARAMTRGATTDVLMGRARRMAETILKRKMFRKAPSAMSRQDKERFEKGASRRKLLVARLAQRLIGKVRAMQTVRLHAQNAGKVSTPTVTTGTRAGKAKFLGAD